MSAYEDRAIEKAVRDYRARAITQPAPDAVPFDPEALRATRLDLLRVARALSTFDSGPSCLGLCRYESMSRSFARHVADLLTFEIDQEARSNERPDLPDTADVGAKCLVCGHYHGGQGSCVTAHAFVSREDCPTCMSGAGSVESRLGKGISGGVLR